MHLSKQQPKKSLKIIFKDFYLNFQALLVNAACLHLRQGYFFSSITACAAASPCELCLQSANAQIASALLLFFDNRLSSCHFTSFACKCSLSAIKARLFFLLDYSLCCSKPCLRNSKRRARYIIQAYSVAEFY